MKKISDKVIGRLSLYRRLLLQLPQNREFIFSHELATIAKSTASQVRRDLMVTHVYGNPARGYEIKGLIATIGQILDQPQEQTAVALVGLGNLGRALVAYMEGGQPKLRIDVAFDRDPEKVDRLYRGIPCYPFHRLSEILQEHQIVTGIIAVPAEAAQAVTDEMVLGGVKGILNFAPVPLHVPADVYLVSIDVMTALEKVVYYARQNAKPSDKRKEA